MNLSFSLFLDMSTKGELSVTAEWSCESMAKCNGWPVHEPERVPRVPLTEDEVRIIVLFRYSGKTPKELVDSGELEPDWAKKIRVFTNCK